MTWMTTHTLGIMHALDNNAHPWDHRDLASASESLPFLLVPGHSPCDLHSSAGYMLHQNLFPSFLSRIKVNLTHCIDAMDGFASRAITLAYT